MTANSSFTTNAAIVINMDNKKLEVLDALPELKKGIKFFEEPCMSSCPICLNLFTYKCNMKRHINDVHKKIKNHRCSQCLKYFSRKHNLRSHIKRMHLDDICAAMGIF